MYIIKDVIKSHSFDLIELESVLLTFTSKEEEEEEKIPALIS